MGAGAVLSWGSLCVLGKPRGMGCLGISGVLLENLWVDLGCVEGSSWPACRFGLPSGNAVSVLGLFGVSWGCFGAVLGASWSVLGLFSRLFQKRVLAALRARFGEVGSHRALSVRPFRLFQVFSQMFSGVFVLGLLGIAQVSPEL